MAETSNTAAITALEMPTMRSRLLVTKLDFPAVGDGEQFWKSQWSNFGGTL